MGHFPSGLPTGEGLLGGLFVERVSVERGFEMLPVVYHNSATGLLLGLYSWLWSGAWPWSPGRKYWGCRVFTRKCPQVTGRTRSCTGGSSSSALLFAGGDSGRGAVVARLGAPLRPLHLPPRNSACGSGWRGTGAFALKSGLTSW